MGPASRSSTSVDNSTASSNPAVMACSAMEWRWLPVRMTTASIAPGEMIPFRLLDLAGGSRLPEDHGEGEQEQHDAAGDRAPITRAARRARQLAGAPSRLC